MSSIQEARRGLRIYLATLLGLTLLFSVPDSLLGLLLPAQTLLVFRSIRYFYTSAPFLVWFVVGSFAPAVASMVARYAQGEGFDDVSFSVRGNWTIRALVVASLWPVGAGIVVYGLAWLFGATRFRLGATWYPFHSWGPEQLLGISIGDMPVLRAFLIRLLASVLFAVPFSLVTFGQELGWRGYMLTRLIEGKVPAPIFWNGLAWGLSYLPTLLAPSPTAALEAPWISFCFQVAGMIALSYLLAYLRLRSGSVWPAVLGASGTVVLALSFDAFTWANPFWKGELYLLSLALTTVVVLLLPRSWRVPMEPDSRIASVVTPV